MRVRKEMMLVMAMVLIASFAASAQSSSGRAVKRNVATVLFATLGGAVLGLSTLPFYGEPQEHTDNISAGAILGMIIGATYVTYASTQTPAPMRNDYGFEESLQNKKALAMDAKAISLVQLSFEF